MLNKICSIFELKTLKKRNKKALNYVCINCGKSVKHLYKKYDSNVLKIMNCEYCHNIADKYIEFETIIILIDLVLLSKLAYRHVIFNTECKNLWKLAVILVLLESYCLWADTFNNLSTKTSLSKHHITDPFLSEKGFYLASLQILLDNLIFFILLRLLTLTDNDNNKSEQCEDTNLTEPTTQENTVEHPPRNLCIDLIKGITLASIGKFFFLPIMIWKDNSTETGVAIHLGLVFGYFLLSLIHVHSVISVSKRFVSVLIVLLCFIVKTYFMLQINLLLKSFLV